MDDLGLFASILGHVGDGNFHESILYDNTDPAERAKVEKCLKKMVTRALDMEELVRGARGVSALSLSTNSQSVHSSLGLISSRLGWCSQKVVLLPCSAIAKRFPAHNSAPSQAFSPRFLLRRFSYGTISAPWYYPAQCFLLIRFVFGLRD